MSRKSLYRLRERARWPKLAVFTEGTGHIEHTQRLLAFRREMHNQLAQIDSLVGCRHSFMDVRLIR